MSKLDIINTEIQRREESTAAFKEAAADLLIAIEQFNKLDEMYRSDEKGSRERLECIYKENRHFTGKWPMVYTFAQTEKYPFFGGPADTDGNPYFPITKVQDKTFDGISPLEMPPTKTGAYQRDRDYSPTEEVNRIPAIAPLAAFPDYQLPDANETGEWFPANWPAAADTVVVPGYCTPTAAPDTEAQCTIDGGVWTPPGSAPVADPVWVASETATYLLRTVLDPWRADIVLIQADVCEDDTAEYDYWQAILDDIDTVLAEIQIDPVFIRATGNTDPQAWGRTPDFAPGSPADLARNRLITASDTGVASHVAARKAFLDKEAETEESLFFGVVKLRLHQANGSYAKLRATKGQKGTNQSLIDDNIAAIASLNLLKVKNS